MNQSRGLRRYLIGDRAFYATVFAIVIPIVIQNGITSFVSLLDNIMVGQLGTAQMSGVAIANQLMFIFNICIFGGISGASIYGAQFYGAGDYESMRAAMRFKLYVAVIIFIIATFAFTLFDDELISLFLNDSDNPEVIAETLAAGKDYLFVMLFGLLPFAITQAYTATLREAGETKLPMIGGIAAILVNMVLNYILIFGHFGFPVLGVVGAAIATVISRYIEFAIIVIASHTEKARYFYMQGLYKTLKISSGLAKRILVRGLPLLANESLWSFGMSYLTQLYSVRGLSVIAAVNIASTVSQLVNTAVYAMGNAVATMVGQSLGANRVEEAKETAWRLIFFSMAIGVIFGIVLAILSPFIPLIYNTTADVRLLATKFMLITAATTLILAFSHCAYFTLRSGGNTVITFVFDSMSVWVIQIPAVYLLIHHTTSGIVLVYFVSQAITILKAIFGAVLVKKGIWINNITEEG